MAHVFAYRGVAPGEVANFSRKNSHSVSCIKPGPKKAALGLAEWLVGALSPFFFWWGPSGTVGKMACAVQGDIGAKAGYITTQGEGGNGCAFFVAGPSRVCCALAGWHLGHGKLYDCFWTRAIFVPLDSCPPKGAWIGEAMYPLPRGFFLHAPQTLSPPQSGPGSTLRGAQSRVRYTRGGQRAPPRSLIAS